MLNTHILVDSEGGLVETYDKAHLFDVEIPGKIRLKVYVFFISVLFHFYSIFVPFLFHFLFHFYSIFIQFLFHFYSICGFGSGSQIRHVNKWIRIQLLYISTCFMKLIILKEHFPIFSSFFQLIFARYNMEGWGDFSKDVYP